MLFGNGVRLKGQKHLNIIVSGNVDIVFMPFIRRFSFGNLTLND